MSQKELSELTDQELLEEAKKVKSNSILNAFFIGFSIAIIIYSIVENNWGLVTLIPLYFAFRLIKKPAKNADLEKLLKERGLK